MVLCFFLSLDSANEVFLYTDSFSQKNISAPSIGIQIFIDFYLNETIKSIAIRNATNSALGVKLLTIFCILEYQIIGDELQYKIFPI